MDNIIHTRGLTKTYRRFEKEPGLTGSVKSLFHREYIDKIAVNTFDMDIGAGEFVGLIGPNGAGKTTLVKMLSGIIAPTSGEISVMGYYPNKLEDAFKRRYAVVMGQKSQLFFELTPSDTFRLFQSLYEIPEDSYRRNVSYFVELFSVGRLMDVQVRTLSLGERMKMELIAALLHNPAVLFLDEPTIGLDAAAQRQMREFLKEVNHSKGTTILLTSHYMEDVRSLCPRGVVVNGGLKLYDGATDKLFDAYQTHKKITIRFSGDQPFILPRGADALDSEPRRVSFMIPKDMTADTLASIMNASASGGTPVEDVSVEEEDIGRVVERIYAAAPKGGAAE